MVRAALEGVGLAFVFESLVADHLAGGRLERMLEDWCPVLPSFFLYYPGRRQVPAPLRAFIDMVRTPSCTTARAVGPVSVSRTGSRG